MTSHKSNIMGRVVMTALSREILFEDERAERLTMPYADRWVQLKQPNQDWTRLELDMGSVMGFNRHWEADMADRIRSTLNDVGNICKDDWVWHSDERTIKDQIKTSQVIGSEGVPNADSLIDVPVDQRKFLIFNFASRDDAMLVRMTIEDLKVVRNDNSGDLS
jgi:hypothetical protein